MHIFVKYYCDDRYKGYVSVEFVDNRTVFNIKSRDRFKNIVTDNIKDELAGIMKVCDILGDDWTRLSLCKSSLGIDIKDNKVILNQVYGINKEFVEFLMGRTMKSSYEKAKNNYKFKI